jgi:hypothetical protein
MSAHVPRPHHPILAAVTILGVALAGCGTGDDRSQAGAVADRFSAALERGDGTVACAQLSVALAQQVSSDAGEPCPRAITSLNVQPARAGAVAVFITNAKVDLANGRTAFLSRDPGGWRLSAIGCAPSAKPADRPFDCDAET